MIIHRHIGDWTFCLVTDMEQDPDNLPVLLGIGGFKYGPRPDNKIVDRKGYCLFLYYGSKYINIHLEKKLK